MNNQTDLWGMVAGRNPANQGYAGRNDQVAQTLPDNLKTVIPSDEEIYTRYQAEGENTSSATKGSSTSTTAEPYAAPDWLSRLNPLDWFPGYGTYISIGAAIVLTVAESIGYTIPPLLYALLATFAGGRIRRAIDRPAARAAKPRPMGY